jgi:hypothetical protein
MAKPGDAPSSIPNPPFPAVLSSILALENDRLNNFQAQVSRQIRFGRELMRQGVCCTWQHNTVLGPYRIASASVMESINPCNKSRLRLQIPIAIPKSRPSACNCQSIFETASYMPLPRPMTHEKAINTGDWLPATTFLKRGRFLGASSNEYKVACASVK